MLAAATDYLFLSWEIPIWVVIIFVSLMLGGYFVSSGIQKTGTVKKMPLGIGILAMFIIGSIASFFSAIVFRLGATMSSGIPYVGLVGAGITFVVMFYLMMWAWLKKLSPKEILRIAVLPIATVMLLAIFVAGPTVMFAYRSRQNTAREAVLINQTMFNLREIYVALRERGVDRPPLTLNVLVEEKLIDADKLKSPSNPKREIGFFYVPVELSYSNREENEDKLIACDYKDNFENYRVVLYSNGKLQRLSEASFQDSLGQPVNKNFKQALDKIENPQAGK